MKTLAVAAALLTLGFASAQNIIDAPEIAVYYVNTNMPADSCTNNQFKYIDNKITPDLDMILRKKNFGDTQWKSTADEVGARMLRGGEEERELNANCDWCQSMRYTNKMCNAMFNCGFRRKLQTGVVLTDAQKTDLAAALKTACKENLMMAASRNVLRGTCATGIAGAECFVEIN